MGAALGAAVRMMVGSREHEWEGRHERAPGSAALCAAKECVPGEWEEGREVLVDARRGDVEARTRRIYDACVGVAAGKRV